MKFECTIWSDRVIYTATGPLGKASCEGPRVDWEKIREKARWLAGYRAEP